MEKLELAEPNRLVMTLKPDMVYQNKAPVNGRKVVASDIVATQEYVKQMTNPENAGFQRNFLDRIEAPNDNTVIFHLKNPTAYLFSSTYLANPTAQPIIPKEMLPQIDRNPYRQRPLRAHRPHLQHQVHLQEVRELPEGEAGHALLRRPHHH